MKIHTVQFPGHMERCSGFTIPDNGQFYAVYFDESLARFDISSGTSEDIENGDLVLFGELSVFELDGVRHPFVGYDGARAFIIATILVTFPW